MVPRAGDNAPMALMQLVDKAAEKVAGEKPAAAKPAREEEGRPGRRRRGGGQAEPSQEGGRLKAYANLMV